MQITLFIFISFFSYSLWANDARTETINDVMVSSDKTSDVRSYRGSISKKVPRSITSVRSAIINFEQKCNNEFKEKRTLTSKENDCIYHNENLIESFIVKDLKNTSKEENEVARYIIARRAYNRGTYEHHDLIVEKHSKNSQNQKVISIEQKMISDKKISDYLEKPIVESNTVFENTKGTFVITELSATETQFDYEYYAETDHWILNKEISVSQVFASITKSLNDLWVSVDKESEKVMRTVASGH